MKKFALCLALGLCTLPALGFERERVFDIVPAEGQSVEVVDGSTVLRQAGQRYGVVLSFAPLNEVQGWIPVAVLNTGSAPLAVGAAGFSATSGDKKLKVYENPELLREFRRAQKQARRDAQASGMPTYAEGVERSRAATMAGPNSPTQLGDVRRRDNALVQGATSPVPPGGDVSTLSSNQQADLLEAVLLPDVELAPGRVVQGQVGLLLPKRRTREAASFVLRLEFGDEVMDVVYRERKD